MDCQRAIFGHLCQMNSEDNLTRTVLSNKKNTRDLIHGLGKIPPQAVELEEAVLGALMLEKDAMTAVVDILRPESFYVEANQKIYSAILRLFAKTQPVDLLTVTQELRRSGELELVGGAIYVTRLTNHVNSAANIEYHARIVSEYAIKRELISISSEVQTDAFEDTTDVFKLLDDTEHKIFAIAEKNIKRPYKDMMSLFKETMNELEARKNSDGGLSGVPSGFLHIDQITGGWQKSDLIILAARPGMGKTAFVVSALRNAAVDHRRPVAIFSLEMSSIQLTARMLSAEAEISSEKIKKADLLDYEWETLYQKGKRLSEAPIFIDDTPALSVMEFRAKCRRLKAQHDIQMIVVDYLQLMEASAVGKSNMGNREQEIATISRALKNVAKELSVPVIALSQLSREVEKRGNNKKPQLSDLRESGSIEQDADMVLFIYRPEYYKITEFEDGQPTHGAAEIIIAKNRHGGLQDVRLRFRSEFTRFEDWEFSDYIPSGGLSTATGMAFFDGEKTLPSKLNPKEEGGFRIQDDFGGEVPF